MNAPEPTRRARTRPRGFAPWNPGADARQAVTDISEVLQRYRDHLPLTLRQVFYSLVAAGKWSKDEAGYQRLIEIANRARRAELLPLDAFRDDGYSAEPPPGWASEDALLFAIRSAVDGARLDRQKGQARRLIVWCEAGGMVPQLRRVADDFGVAVRSSGGFDSLTAKHSAAAEIAQLAGEAEAEILHCGDLDPSGEHVFSALAEDVAAFCRRLGGVATFARLAVTVHQAEALALPTAPPKASDRRSFSNTYTVQAEAIPPDTLAAIVRDAIEARVDHAVRAAVLAEEEALRRRLLARFEGIL